MKTVTELQTALDSGGDIVLGSDIGVNATLTIKTSASIDLNGYKLTIITTKDSAIVIDPGQTLTISDSKYTEGEAGSGKLSATGYHAGIQTCGGTLVINSGVVEATGQYATGIGGIDKTGYYDGGTVTINGGVVTATGGCPGTFGGAGIGSMGAVTTGTMGSSGTITINGGTVTAIGGSYAAGIGGGGSAGSSGGGSNGGTIAINGGSVTATGGIYGAGIGGGGNGMGCTVTISGGTVTAHGGTARAGDIAYDIGSGRLNDNGGSLTVTGGTVALAAYGTNAANPTFKSCTITGDGANPYSGTYDANGNRIVLDGASAWAQESILAAINNDLLPQSLQSNYTQATTRAEFCALAVALYEKVTGAEIAERKTFADTTDINVEKMGALGVVSGVDAENFAPNTTLTREQAATMLARLAEALGKPLPTQSATFADNDKIASWAIAQVGQVQAANIMSGGDNNTFNPTGSYTREQSVITIVRLYEVVQ